MKRYMACNLLCACAKFIELESKNCSVFKFISNNNIIFRGIFLMSDSHAIAIDNYEDLSGDCLPNNKCVMILVG